MSVKRRAIYPGSFAPPTCGHVDIVRRSLELTDEVVVAVVYNPQKQDYLFTPEERLEMFREELEDAGDRVIYDSFHGLLVDYAHEIGASAIIRGLRAVSDFEYEFQMTLMNRHLSDEVETIFLMPTQDSFYRPGWVFDNLSPVSIDTGALSTSRRRQWNTRCVYFPHEYSPRCRGIPSTLSHSCIVRRNSGISLLNPTVYLSSHMG